MRNPKFETLNSKQYQNSNFKNGLIILDLEHLNLSRFTSSVKTRIHALRKILVFEEGKNGI